MRRTSLQGACVGTLVTALVLVLAVGLVGCGGSSGDGKRVIVLGVDGMDYAFARQMIDEGELPNFARLEQMGQFRPLETSAPPLSPVAWSNFITGMDSGGHGIFDFIHRNPEDMIPFLSTSEQDDHGEYVLLRHGTPFWEVLEDEGVETTVIRMPANFPVTEKATREVSGMGTPDIQGTYGWFSFYTSELFLEDKEIGGGSIYPLNLWGDTAEGTLFGPPGPPDEDGRPGDKLEVDFVLHRDAELAVALLEVEGQSVVLQPGEWSEWVEVVFDYPIKYMPDKPIPSITRFYLRQLEPEIELYAAPMNFDPMAPEIPLGYPAGYTAELSEATGRFYTQGMPEDTKALTEGVLTRDEFLAQAKIAGRELVEQYEYVLGEFEDGLLFYYFGNLDQVCHIMWRTIDPTHPAYSEEDKAYGDVVRQLYRNADAVVGYTLDNMGDDTTLVVMSDHGFSSWKRAFNLNTWLYQNGYLALKNPDIEKDPGLYLNVDWSKTRAYGLGLNGLYVNVRGRERDGIVDESEKKALLEEIAAGLLEAVDPETGEQAITRVYQSDVFFKDRGYLDIGPDIVVGYAKGMKGSDESALGEITPEIYSDNMGAWSGDHGMDHTTVPGVYFSNRVLKKEATSLTNLAAAILGEFGIEEFPVKR